MALPYRSGSRTAELTAAPCADPQFPPALKGKATSTTATAASGPLGWDVVYVWTFTGDSCRVDHGVPAVASDAEFVAPTKSQSRCRAVPRALMSGQVKTSNDIAEVMVMLVQLDAGATYVTTAAPAGQLRFVMSGALDASADQLQTHDYSHLGHDAPVTVSATAEGIELLASDLPQVWA